MIWRVILIAISAFFIGHVLGKYLVALHNIRKHRKEKHFCNKCEVGFLASFDQMNYLYCPYCGEPLDYHHEDERSKDYKGEE